MGCTSAQAQGHRGRWNVTPEDFKLLMLPGIKCLALQNLSLIDVNVSFYIVATRLFPTALHNNLSLSLNDYSPLEWLPTALSN